MSGGLGLAKNGHSTLTRRHATLPLFAQTMWTAGGVDYNNNNGSFLIRLTQLAEICFIAAICFSFLSLLRNLHHFKDIEL
jgi:hypothetical protein